MIYNVGSRFQQPSRVSRNYQERRQIKVREILTRATTSGAGRRGGAGGGRPLSRESGEATDGARVSSPRDEVYEQHESQTAGHGGVTEHPQSGLSHLERSVTNSASDIVIDGVTFHRFTARPSGGLACTPLRKTFGYKPHHNELRWNKICHEIGRDLDAKCRQPGTIRVADYGSNQGYFSISASTQIPNAKVISIDRGVAGKAMQKHGLDNHRSFAKEFNATHDLICDTDVQGRMFEALGEAWDYQFVLSFFHWLKFHTQKEYEEHLVRLLSNAATTFLELPSPWHSPGELKVSFFTKWYKRRRDLNAIVASALQAHKGDFRVTILSNHIDVKGRFIYRVDNLRLGGGCHHGAHRKVWTKSDKDWCNSSLSALECSQGPGIDTCDSIV